ncbi:MAG: hypothetical protein FWH35_04905 [Treponema sp.]|nr:hypothetical protein [Treponema sp.]
MNKFKYFMLIAIVTVIWLSISACKGTSNNDDVIDVNLSNTVWRSNTFGNVEIRFTSDKTFENWSSFMGPVSIDEKGTYVKRGSTATLTYTEIISPKTEMRVGDKDTFILTSNTTATVDWTRFGYYPFAFTRVE